MLTATPKNPIVSEIKSTFLFNDLASYSSEITREFLYSNTTFFKFVFFKNFFELVSLLNNNYLNLIFFNNYFNYLLNITNNSNFLGNNVNLLKSQYRPIKKGVTNMIRLQATSAIAIPTEIRLHILASSKDVIHS